MPTTNASTWIQLCGINLTILGIWMVFHLYVTRRQVRRGKSSGQQTTNIVKVGRFLEVVGVFVLGAAFVLTLLAYSHPSDNAIPHIAIGISFMGLLLNGIVLWQKTRTYYQGRLVRLGKLPSEKKLQPDKEFGDSIQDSIGALDAAVALATASDTPPNFSYFSKSSLNLRALLVFIALVNSVFTSIVLYGYEAPGAFSS